MEKLNSTFTIYDFHCTWSCPLPLPILTQKSPPFFQNPGNPHAFLEGLFGLSIQNYSFYEYLGLLFFFLFFVFFLITFVGFISVQS